MSAEQASEPTMDEILASIRRIISDEPTEQAGDTSGQFATSNQIRSGQNERGTGGSSVADDIARALSADPKPDPVQADLGQQLDNDIFQLTDDQVAVSTGHSIDPVQEMERVLQEQESGTNSVMAESSFAEGGEAVSKSESPAEQEQIAQEVSLQQPPVQQASDALDTSQESNLMPEPGIMHSPSPIVDPLEDQLEVRAENSSSDVDRGLTEEQQMSNFDLEIGSKVNISPEDRSATVDLDLQTDFSSQSNILDSAKPGFDNSMGDELFSNDTTVDSTDINEANDILSGSPEIPGAHSEPSEVAENSQFPVELDMEPPALTSAVLSEVDVQPEDGMDHAGKMGEGIPNHKSFTPDLSMEPLPDLGDSQDASDTVPDQLIPIPELIEKQAVSERVEDTGQASPGLEDLPGFKSEQTSEDFVQKQASVTSFEKGIKDMLRPMIQNWLDENMPRLVQGAIKDEMNSRRDDD